MSKKSNALKYFLTSVVLNCFRPIAWFPPRLNAWIGKMVGQVMYHTSSSLRNCCIHNIERCFPEYTPEERNQLVKKTFESAGQGFIECAMVAWPREKALLKRIHTLEGVEILTRLREEKQGILILFPHFSALYIMAYLIQRKTKLPFSLMYHRPKNPVLDHFMRSRLETYGDEVFTRKDLKKMISALHNKKIVWYAADIDSGINTSVFAPFFNHPAATTTLPMRLAELTGAKVCLSSFFRREDGSGYDIKISEPFDHFPSGDPIKDATRMNAALEHLIRIQPHQYLWTMKRFKTRPAAPANISPSETISAG